ncbi:MAG: PAS domain S-box protein [Bacteroidota bacterium]
MNTTGLPIRNHKIAPSKTALIYFIVSFLWIFFSDKSIEQIFPDAHTVSLFQTIKGLFFISTTSLLIYFLIRRDVFVLQNQNRLLENIIETSPIGITFVDKNGKVTFANKEAEEVLGLKKEKIETLNYNAADWKISALNGSPFPDKDLPFTKVKHTKAPVRNIEHAIEYPDGRRTFLSINASPILDNHSEFDGMIATIADITEQKKIERELHEKDLLLEETGRIAKVGGWEFDAITLKGTWTEQLARIHDLDPSQSTNVELGISFYKDESRLNIEKAITEAVAHGTPYDLELEMITAKGNHKWIRTIGHPVVENNKVVKVIGSFQDITEQKIVEEKRKKTEEALISTLEINRILSDKIYRNEQESVTQLQLDRTIRILNLDDSSTDSELNRQALEEDNLDMEFTHVSTKEEFISALMNNEYDLILSDYHMPNYDAPSALNYVKEHYPSIPVIILSGTVYDENILVELLKQGARDYVNKNKIAKLPLAVRRTLNEVRILNQQRQVEKALRESEERYRLVLENSLDAVLLTAPDGSIYSANHAACEMFQRTEEEISIVGRNGLVDLSDPRLHILIEERKRTGKVKGELFMLRKDGTKFPTEISSSIFTDSKGQIRTSMIIRDISERKKAEANLVESEKRYRALFENMTAGFVLFEAVQNENGIPIDLIILAANDGFEKTTGLKLKDVIGKNLTKVLPGIEKDSADWIGTYGKVALTGLSKQFEQGSDLLGVYYSINAYQAGPNQCAVTFNDISERRRVEQDLLNYHKQLEELTKHLQNAREEEREAIAREIHDEFGQVLTSLKMNLTLMKRKFEVLDKDEFSKSINDMTQLIDRAVQHMRNLITELRPEILDKLGLIPAMEWQIDEFVQRYKIPVSFDCKLEKTEFDKYEKLSVFRILQESLTNITKHSKATEVKITFEKSDNNYLLTIIDNGVGIDETKITSKSFGIIGMKERAKLIGAGLNIESSVGKGTRTILSIPAKDS